MEIVGAIVIAIVVVGIIVFIATKKSGGSSHVIQATDSTKLLLFSDTIQFVDVVINSIGNKKGILANFNILIENYLGVTPYIVIPETENKEEFEIVSDKNIDYNDETYLQFLADASSKLGDKNSIIINGSDLKKYRYLTKNGVKSVYVSALRDKDVAGLLFLESKQVKFFKGKKGELDCISNYIVSVLSSSEQYRSIENLAKKDFLTGLYNRLSLLDNITEMMKTAKTLAVAMFDIDHFKNVNDTYGHQSGDIVLQFLAKKLEENIEKNIMIHRYGGEEFLLIGKNFTAESATKLVEGIRRSIEQSTIKIIDTSIKITISAGVYTTTILDNPKEIIGIADKNLYKAKNTGRNKVVSSTDITDAHILDGIDGGLLSDSGKHSKIHKSSATSSLPINPKLQNTPLEQDSVKEQSTEEVKENNTKEQPTEQSKEDNKEQSKEASVKKKSIFNRKHTAVK